MSLPRFRLETLLFAVGAIALIMGVLRAATPEDFPSLVALALLGISSAMMTASYARRRRDAGVPLTRVGVIRVFTLLATVVAAMVLGTLAAVLAFLYLYELVDRLTFSD